MSDARDNKAAETDNRGLWGDLHTSVVKPTTAEIAALFAIGDKFEVR